MTGLTTSVPGGFMGKMLVSRWQRKNPPPAACGGLMSQSCHFLPIAAFVLVVSGSGCTTGAGLGQSWRR